MTKLADWIIERAKRTPYFHLDGYMERWWLFGSKRTNDDNKEGDALVTARVHHILRSDMDRWPHDHPRCSISYILKDGYYEELPTTKDPLGPKKLVWRGPGSFVFRWPWSTHRIVLVNEGTSRVIQPWTVFIMFGPKRDWGFHTPKGRLHWTEYRKHYP